MAKGNVFSKITCPLEPNRNPEWLAVKFPGNEFMVGSILETPPGTVCIAVHGGKVEHIFEAGSTVLDTENFPFIKGTVRKLFGGKPPFAMEFYFINRTARHKFLWGTANGVTVSSACPEDMGITYTFGARGDYFVRIKHYQFFYEWILGGLAYGEFVYWERAAGDVRDYIAASVETFLSTFVVENKIGFGEVQTMGKKCAAAMMEEFKSHMEHAYGLELQDVTCQIALDPKDKERLNKAREEAQRAAQLGRLNDVAYARGAQYRQLDVQTEMAKNEGSLGGLMGAGMGLGAGLAMMGQAPGVMQGNTNPTMSGNNVQYGPQGAPQTAPSVKCPKCGANNPPDAKFCGSCGQSLAQIECPNCHTKVPGGTKFCPNCGSSLEAKNCPSCGTKLAPGAKFCPNCGTKIE